ncbi:hypothetical protein [Echinicola salinicaeni]|uniref:hypothetical protein n=1 Tax=Echinicola salinicaeni TaxID=2762757 RepID=UPI00164534B4|nr:hypothetical protein [Echinicola salinicaeni]
MSNCRTVEPALRQPGWGIGGLGFGIRDSGFGIREWGMVELMDCRTVEPALRQLGWGIGGLWFGNGEWLNWLIVWGWGIANALLYEFQIANLEQHYLVY